MTQVVFIAYKIEARRGSEDGSGYAVASRLAARADIELTIISRPNNIELLKRDPSFQDTRLVGVALPRAIESLKRGSTWIIPYYYLWQLMVGLLIHRAFRANDKPSSVVHQYNFHTDWAPHFIPSSLKTVWGPICHQPGLPGAFFDGLPLKYRLADFIRNLTKWLFWHLDPFLKRAAARTDIVLYANRDVAPPFRRRSVELQLFGGLSEALERAGEVVSPMRAGARLRLLHVGRFVPIKGALQALDAIAVLRRRGVALEARFVGSGRLATVLRHRIKMYGLGDVVSVDSWVAHDELAQIYADSDIFIYPSLGNQDTAVAEALGFGLPIVCLSGSGTAEMAGDYGFHATVGRSRAAIAESLADAVEDCAAWAMADRKSTTKKIRQHAAQQVSWDATVEGLIRRYRRLTCDDS